ncbi:MAG: hypothetical protein U1F61_00700 [Opitutaceae bacterium]
MSSAGFSPDSVPAWVGLAAQTAAEAHAGQFRRDGVTPYLKHPEAVVARVRGDASAEAVAWLHDVLEDTPLTVEDLRRRGIPDEVVGAVSLLTKGEGCDYGAYLARVRDHPLARKVKIADMLANLSDHPTERQIVKYAQGLLVLMNAPALSP